MSLPKEEKKTNNLLRTGQIVELFFRIKAGFFYFSFSWYPAKTKYDNTLIILFGEVFFKEKNIQINAKQ